MKKILIADDHPAIRDGVKTVLTNLFSEVEVGEAANATEALEKAAQQKWDLIILDVDMPGRSGLDALKELKEMGSTIPVLIFSMHPQEQVAIRAMRSGAWGYLSKDSANTELANAIHTILGGRKYITPSLAEQLAGQLQNPESKAPHELLSDREFQTLVLIAKGKTLSQIADELSLSIHTISTYRARILEKMALKSNAELTSYAIRSKLA